MCTHITRHQFEWSSSKIRWKAMMDHCVGRTCQYDGSSGMLRWEADMLLALTMKQLAWVARLSRQEACLLLTSTYLRSPSYWHVCLHNGPSLAFHRILAAGTIQIDVVCVGCTWWSLGHIMQWCMIGSIVARGSVGTWWSWGWWVWKRTVNKDWHQGYIFNWNISCDFAMQHWSWCASCCNSIIYRVF